MAPAAREPRVRGAEGDREAMNHQITRVRLTLTSWEGLSPFASHWYCRIRWTDSRGEDHELDAEHRRGVHRTKAFDKKVDARAAGVALAKRACRARWKVVTEGSGAVIDPQECLFAPGNLRSRLNRLWREFEELGGWDEPKVFWPRLEEICDSWSRLIGDKW